MDYLEKEYSIAAVKEMTLAALNQLVLHNIKGAELIKKGVEQALEIKQEFDKYYETLKIILNVLKPIFEIAREWLVSAYEHLVAIFDWAKEKWNEIFG